MFLNRREREPHKNKEIILANHLANVSIKKFVSSNFAMIASVVLILSKTIYIYMIFVRTRIDKTVKLTLPSDSAVQIHII